MDRLIDNVVRQIQQEIEGFLMASGVTDMNAHEFSLHIERDEFGGTVYTLFHYHDQVSVLRLSLKCQKEGV